MKRIVSVLLLIMMLCTLAACDRGEYLPENAKISLDKAVVEIGETHSGFEGMSIRITDIVWNDDEIKLYVDWINETVYDALYGEMFTVEREINGDWISCQTLDNLAFTSIGYELKSGITQNKTYSLTDTFDISQNGKYRFKTDCLVYDKGRGGEYTECELWAEFTVTRIGDTSNEVKKTFVEFETQYIRTNGYREGIEYPVIKIIRSVQELNDYYEANKEIYDLERREDPSSDNSIGFLDACDKYDEAYFEDQILVMVLLEEGSGSNRHNVDNVKISSDGKLYVSISSIIPEAGTYDMAEWHILIEPEKGIDVKDESDVIVLLDGINPRTQPRTVRESGDFSNITLTIPRTWKYETERGNDTVDYCISFWPEDETEGKIKLWFYDAFSVCGTGLKEEEITLGEYKARRGTYDNKKVWDFISFTDTPGEYVAMNDGAEKWWDQYGDEAMQILSSARLAEGIIHKDKAIEIAKKEVTVEYDKIYADFDTEKGLWTVSFGKKTALGGDQSFSITHEGKITDVKYGE